MQIREVHAHGFGALVDQRLTLAGGVTVVGGPNESGKSTWHAALAVALTGVRKGRTTKADRAFIERYTPWTTDVFAVSAVVELDGELLRVHRDLARGTESVLDERTGQDVTARFVSNGSVDLSVLVGLDRRTLPLAAFVRQGEILAVTEAAGDDGDALRSFLQRAAASRSDADGTAELAIGRIDKFVKTALGSDRRNSTKPLRAAIDAADAMAARADDAQNAQVTANRLRGELAAVDRELAHLRATEQQADVAAAESTLMAHRRELAEAERLEVRLAAATAVLEESGDAPAVSVQTLRRLAWELTQPAPVMPSELAQRHEAASAQVRTNQTNERTLLGIAAAGVCLVVVAVLAAVLSLLGTGPATGLAGFGVVVLAGAAGAARRRRVDAAGALQQAEDIRDDLTRHRALAAEHVRRTDEAGRQAKRLGLVPNAHVVQDAADSLEAAERDRLGAYSEAEATRAALSAILGGRTMTQLREQVQVGQAVVARRAADLTPVTHAGAVDSGQDLALVRSRLATATTRRDGLVAELAASTARVGDLTELNEERERAVAERDRLVRLRRLSDQTKAFLDQARLEVHREIAPRLAHITEERLAKVTAGRYKELRVDPEDLTVRLLTETGAWRQASSVSLGTQEQIYLLLRAAIAELVAPAHESCPLVLDEVTVHADSERLDALLDTVDLLGQSRQVVLFTQEERVLAWASAGGHETRMLARP